MFRVTITDSCARTAFDPGHPQNVAVPPLSDAKGTFGGQCVSTSAKHTPETGCFFVGGTNSDSRSATLASAATAILTDPPWEWRSTNASLREVRV